jgi:hypothetical protein
VSQSIRYGLRTAIHLEDMFKGRHEFYVIDSGLTATEAVEMAVIWSRDVRRFTPVTVSRACGKVELVLV